MSAVGERGEGGGVLELPSDTMLAQLRPTVYNTGPAYTAPLKNI